MRDTNVDQLNNWLKQRGVTAFLKAGRIMNKKTGRYEYCLVRYLPDGSNEFLTQYCTSNPNELIAVAEKLIASGQITTKVNISTVREANSWLKKMGVGNVLKFSTRNDSMYGKVYVLSEVVPGGSTRMIVKSPGLGECVETAKMVIGRMR